jgi:hypothetical protein
MQSIWLGEQKKSCQVMWPVLQQCIVLNATVVCERLGYSSASPAADFPICTQVSLHAGAAALLASSRHAMMPRTCYNGNHTAQCCGSKYVVTK